jgi:TolB protein
VKRVFASLLLVGVVLGLFMVWSRPTHSQGVDVFLNVTQGGSKKMGIAIPELAREANVQDPLNFAQKLPEIIGNDLRFSSLFAVVSNSPALPRSGDALKAKLTEFASAGAHAAMQGYLGLTAQRVTVDFRLYDLTNPAFPQIASKSFWVEPVDRHRKLAHRIADEIVLQFTGERGIAETNLAYVTQSGPVKEIAMIDYDGFNQLPLTRLGNTSLSPVWSPTDSTVAFTSFFQGYPYLYAIFPFNPRRHVPNLMSAWPGINSAAAWAPDGKAIALTLSKDGNPEIYTLRLGTSNFQRLTNNRGIDTDPTWSPTGREIAFISDRTGSPQVWIMDAEGANPRRLTFDNGFDTQPRWSPRGDTIVFTRRVTGGFDLWAIAPDGGNARALTRGQGSNESAAWAPNGRHIAFSSTRQGGRSQLFTMLADGTEQQPLTKGQNEASSPTWSPRPP